MKKAELVKTVEQGHAVTVGTYFGTKAERISYRDKKTGQRASFAKKVHTVIIGSTPALVSERVGDDFDDGAAQAEYSAGKLPFKPGTMVLVRLDGLSSSRGHTDISGTVEPYTD